MEKDRTCFTIGHSTHELNKFFNLLDHNNIDCIVDIRSTPYSKVATSYNRESLKSILKASKIKYIYMGDQLGARYKDKKVLNESGRVDFSKVRQTKNFMNGIIRVINGIKMGYKIAIMCSEKDPLSCHRFSLVSRELARLKADVNHIFENGNIFHHEQLETKIVSQLDYSPEFSIFDNISVNDNTSKLEIAYRKLNDEIGYINHDIPSNLIRM